MSNGKHISYRGVSVDMEALRNENENVPAMGNMNVNAKGDVLGQGGQVAKTVEQVAKENRRVRTAIQHTSLKDNVAEVEFEETPARKSQSKVSPAPQKVEKELSNRDIIQDEGK